MTTGYIQLDVKGDNVIYVKIYHRPTSREQYGYLRNHNDIEAAKDFLFGSLLRLQDPPLEDSNAEKLLNDFEITEVDVGLGDAGLLMWMLHQ